MVAYRRGGAFCKGIVNTARRGGLPFAPAKGSKTGQRGTKLSPLQTPLTLSCAGYEYCFSLNNREKQIRTAHRCAPKVAAGASAPSSYPSPAAGEGPPIPITACSVYSLGSVTFCYWFAVVPNKIRRRHLESVSAALYGRCQASFVSSRSLAARESWGTAPSVSGVTRHGAQPATTRTYKSRAPAAIRTDRHLLVTPPRRRRPPIWLKNSFSHFSS